MGIVYLAEDTKLKRNVAIKFLPNRISINSEEKQRFEIEAQAAASLNHPNIATIHAIEEINNEIFIVMEYIEGKELKDVIELQNESKLSIMSIVNYAKQIAEGLDSAHKKGIIHRDIKSTNIMITDDDKIKIMDFGLAKIGGGSQITKVRSTIGTAAYMSPEQFKGEEVDKRTDIWSFGVVLYEMVAGKLPFTGDYEQSISYAIVNENHKPVSTYREDVPDKLRYIIKKCLEKNAKDRFQNMEELLSELNTLNENSTIGQTINESYTKSSNNRNKIFIVSAIILLFLMSSFLLWYYFSGSNYHVSRSHIPLKRIAVLPLTNLNNDKDFNFLSFAIADQIINSLAYVRELLVRPSSAIRKYQNQNIDVSQVAQKLGVDYVLSGSYLKEGNKIRLNLEMVDVHSNNLVWHDRIEVTYENTFKLQDIVSEKVVQGLKVKFLPEEEILKEKNIPNDPIAYEYYLKAISYPVNNSGNLSAIDLLNKSFKIDSNFAPVYVELGFRNHALAVYDSDFREKIKVAEASYKKALEINNQSLAALGNLASLYTEIGKATEAVQLIKKALNINPNSAESHFWLGYVYRYTGMLDDAINEMESAVNLDPANSRFRSIGVTYMYLSKYKEAIEGLNLDKDSPYSKAFKGQVYMREKKNELAKQLFQEVIKSEPYGTLGLWSKAMLDFITGKREDGLASIKELETSKVFDAEQLYNYANLYGLYGQKDDCVRVLKRAIDAGFYCYPYMLKDEFLNPVRNDADFKQVLGLAKSKYLKFKQSLD